MIFKQESEISTLRADLRKNQELLEAIHRKNSKPNTIEHLASKLSGNAKADKVFQRELTMQGPLPPSADAFKKLGNSVYLYKGKTVVQVQPSGKNKFKLRIAQGKQPVEMTLDKFLQSFWL